MHVMHCGKGKSCIFTYQLTTMNLRILFGFFITIAMSSCEFIQSSKGKLFSSQAVDTIVDYHKVDEYPQFPVCKDLLDIDKKNRCFINNLYNHFADDLLKETFGVPECTNEVVTVKLLFDAEGKTSLVSIESSELVQNAIPELETIIKNSVSSLPVLRGALKRSIPVSTVFELPIVIKIK